MQQIENIQIGILVLFFCSGGMAGREKEKIFRDSGFTGGLPRLVPDPVCGFRPGWIG